MIDWSLMNPVPGIKSKGRLGEDWAREGRNLFVSIGTTQSPDGVNLFPLQMAWWGEDFCSGVDPLTQLMVIRDLILARE